MNGEFIKTERGNRMDEQEDEAMRQTEANETNTPPEEAIAEPSDKRVNEALKNIDEEQEGFAKSVKEDLIVKLAQLKYLREVHTILSEEYLQKQKEFEEKNADLIKKLDENRDNAATVDSELRVLGIARYAETKELKFEGGMGIKRITKLKYDPKLKDQELFICHAKHLPGALCMCDVDDCPKKIKEDD